MGHYRSNLRDIEFNLFEVFGTDRVLGTGPFAEMDAETARGVLAEVDRLCREDLAASFTDADRNPPTFDPQTGSVTLPDSLKASFRAYVEGEWFRLGLPEHMGGLGASPSLRWACAEMMLGANPALFLYAAGASFASVLDQLGNATQKRIAQLMVDRGWCSTMVLTEPDAGSDVGAGRSKAIAQPDGSWHLEGVKRFITSGDQDVTENIIHLVLARPEGAGPGSKGLSLFVVPKFLFDVETGRLGARNGVYATNVEHKMGLKASATCELTLGARHPAVGWLVGDVHRGIAQMFQIIEHARMMVGSKAIATLSTGYLLALDFAKTRVQGPDLARMTDKTAPRVTIIHHPDVRRMLMTQKAYVEGMRALVLYAASIQDKVECSAAHDGQPDDGLVGLNDLLLPIVKGFGSEKSYELLGTCLQVLGGSGYLQDYPVEQYIRDSKIDTLYEGTTSIQGMDLFFRKIVRDKGQALARLLQEIQDFADSETGNGQLKLERAALGRALEDVQAIIAVMVSDLTAAADEPSRVHRVGLNTTRLLMAMGQLVTGWLLLRQASVALDALTAGPAPRDTAFYQGKVAAASFFAGAVLPELAAARTVAAGADPSLMELPEAAF